MTEQKTKQERKEEASEEYRKAVLPIQEEHDRIDNIAWDKYLRKCREIDAEPETKCPTCGKLK